MKMSEMKKILIPFVAVSMLLTACTWNDYKPLDFIQKTPQECDPGGYEVYLAAVKDFKNTEHNLMLVGMDGSASAITSQPSHPMSMPDSADYLIIRSPHELHISQAAELEEVYEKKGTKSLAYIDLEVLRKTWELIQDEREEEGKVPSSKQEAIEWFAAETNRLLIACDKYAYHGIVFSAEGVPDKVQEVFLEVVDKWVASHSDKELFFRGSIRNIGNQKLLEKCNYVIIVAGPNATVGELTLHTTRILGTSKVKDRVIMEVTVPSSSIPQQVGATPQIAAEWVTMNKTHKKFTPKGVVVANGQDDYYRNEMIFVNIRKAIKILNTVNE